MLDLEIFGPSHSRYVTLKAELPLPSSCCKLVACRPRSHFKGEPSSSKLYIEAQVETVTLNTGYKRNITKIEQNLTFYLTTFSSFWCPLMSTNVHKCPPMSINVRLIPYMSANVRLRPSTSVYVRLCPVLSFLDSMRQADKDGRDPLLFLIAYLPLLNNCRSEET